MVFRALAPTLGVKPVIAGSLAFILAVAAWRSYKRLASVINGERARFRAVGKHRSKVGQLDVGAIRLGKPLDVVSPAPPAWLVHEGELRLADVGQGDEVAGHGAVSDVDEQSTAIACIASLRLNTLCTKSPGAPAYVSHGDDLGRIASFRGPLRERSESAQ